MEEGRGAREGPGMGSKTQEEKVGFPQQTMGGMAEGKRKRKRKRESESERERESKKRKKKLEQDP